MEQKQKGKKFEYKFRVSPELHDLITTYATENGIRKAEAIREICVDKFADYYNDETLKDVPRI